MLAGGENLLEKLRMRAFDRDYVAKSPGSEAVWDLWKTRWEASLELQGFGYVFSASPTP